MIKKIAAGLCLTLSLSACGGGSVQTENQVLSENERADNPKELTLYSGRKEKLIGDLIGQYEQEFGVDVKVKYGDSSQLAALIATEGEQTPADVFWAQDAGALGLVANKELFADLPGEMMQKVGAVYRSPQNKWIGVSGRARVVVYNTEKLTEDQLPKDIFGFCAAEWKGKLGWAPTNGSFQSFVTALRVMEGEEKATEWLKCMVANEVKVYPKNTPIVAAVGAGEIEAGFVNHYYLYRFLAEKGDSFAAKNYYLPGKGAGSLVNVAGVGVLKSGDQQAAEHFVDYLLSKKAQGYFVNQTREYPLVQDLEFDVQLPKLMELPVAELDLTKLEDLEGTLNLLKELEIL